MEKVHELGSEPSVSVETQWNRQGEDRSIFRLKRGSECII